MIVLSMFFLFWLRFGSESDRLQGRNKAPEHGSVPEFGSHALLQTRSAFAHDKHHEHVLIPAKGLRKLTA